MDTPTSRGTPNQGNSSAANGRVSYKVKGPFRAIWGTGPDGAKNWAPISVCGRSAKSGRGRERKAFRRRLTAHTRFCILRRVLEADHMGGNAPREYQGVSGRCAAPCRTESSNGSGGIGATRLEADAERRRGCHRDSDSHGGRTPRFLRCQVPQCDLCAPRVRETDKEDSEEGHRAGREALQRADSRPPSATMIAEKAGAI